MVIPRFVKAAIDKSPINIFGDGSQTRVFCHVSDVVRAILNLAVLEESVGEVFNIGGKGEVSILELANLVIKVGNSSSNIIFTKYSEAYPIGYEDMLRRVPDISKIVSTTGWTPKIDLLTIVKDVYESFAKKI
jgi:UDP-glucose 4-epimerase